MLTLIGSRAIKYWFPDFREPNGDWDYHTAAPIDRVKEYDAIGVTRYDLFSDERLGAWNWGPIATVDELYTMKISHGYWDINGSWDKHAADIVFLQRHGAKFIPELHDILLKIWKDRYPANKITLKQSGDTFFTDHVQYVYVHDTVHESVAYHARPWYESYLVEGEDVLCDKDKFFSLPLESQLEAFREELYVIALERRLIPAGYKGSPMSAYRWALRRLCVSLFKNEWATFALRHLDELGKPDVDFVKRHRDNSHMLRLMPQKEDA